MMLSRPLPRIRPEVWQGPTRDEYTTEARLRRTIIPRPISLNPRMTDEPTTMVPIWIPRRQPLLISLHRRMGEASCHPACRRPHPPGTSHSKHSHHAHTLEKGSLAIPLAVPITIMATIPHNRIRPRLEQIPQVGLLDPRREEAVSSRMRLVLRSSNRSGSPWMTHVIKSFPLR